MQSVSLFDDLQSAVEQVQNTHALTGAERENLWSKSAATYCRAIQDGCPQAEAKKIITTWLWRAIPKLAKSPAGMLIQLYRKIGRAQRGDILADKRHQAGRAKRTPTLSKEDRQALLDEGVNRCAGMVDYAWQTCIKKKLLSAALLDRYTVPGNRRPRCPKAVRKAVGPVMRLLYLKQARPHQLSNLIAPMTRDWGAVYAQDWYSTDDKTLDVYCQTVTAENGVQTVRKSRPQFLPMIDEKSGKVLDFVLIGERNYNSVSIRTLMKKVCLKYGLPKFGFVFENGIFRTARLLGNNKAGKPWTEVENVATRCGIEIKHAAPGRARTKLVETVLRLLDRKMFGFPGYAGPDEQHKPFERLNRLKLRMDARDYDAAKDGRLLTFDELMAALTDAVEEYNNTPSESQVKQGFLAPNEVWATNRRTTEQDRVEPAAYMLPEFEYLLCAHKALVKVRVEGVKAQIGKRVYRFSSPAIIEPENLLLGNHAYLWFDPELPERGWVTDLSEQYFYGVAGVPLAPAHARTPAERAQLGAAGRPYREAMAMINEHYSNLPVTSQAPARPVLAHPVALERARKTTEAIEDADRLAAQVSDTTEGVYEPHSRSINVLDKFLKTP